MSIDQIKKNYENQYNAGIAELDKTKTNAHADLDKQAAEGKVVYYNDRDKAAYNNAKQVQQIRDYMASNNLMQSGESVDALLRGNTDFSNALGTINSNEDRFNKDILANRNKANNAYEQDKLAMVGRLTAQANADVLEQRRYEEQLAFEKKKYEEQMALEREKLAMQRAAQQAAQQAAASRSYSSRGSSSSGKTDLKNKLNDMLNNHDQYQSVKGFLNDNKGEIISQYGDKYWADINKKYESGLVDWYKVQNAKTQNYQTQNPSWNKYQYGY